ncbi:MAG: hypothetical protein FWG99_00825 [Treponema sp.]|nr:hypothetical protein [Treponema sp.]
MKKNLLLKPALPLLALILFLFCACNEPVFYTISQEVAPIEPKIRGGPTNFTVWNNSLYVASGNKLHWYKEGVWGGAGIRQPGGKIIMLASTDNYLYALCLRKHDSPGSVVVRRIGVGEALWTELTNVPGHNVMQSIYAPDPSAAEPVLFIGAGNNPPYTILSLNENTSGMEILVSDSGELSGAAWNGTDFYLSTKSNYVYGVPKTFFDDPSVGSINVFTGDVTRGFAGIINLPGNKIIAIDRGGNVYGIGAGGIDDNRIATLDGLASGALAIWEDPITREKILLAGRIGSLLYSAYSGYTYGYQELELDEFSADGIKDGASFREPGRLSPSSVSDGGNERYKSSIGKNPVNHIFQTPESVDPIRFDTNGARVIGGMRLFASTQKNGIWSYRVRDGTPQWNAED